MIRKRADTRRARPANKSDELLRQKPDAVVRSKSGKTFNMRARVALSNEAKLSQVLAAIAENEKVYGNELIGPGTLVITAQVDVVEGR